MERGERQPDKDKKEKTIDVVSETRETDRCIQREARERHK